MKSSKLCSVLASTGVIASVALTAYGTQKVVVKYQQHCIENGKPTKKELLKLSYKHYIAPAVTVVGTIAAITGADIINAKSQAAMLASMAALKKSYDKYGETVKKVFGTEGEKQVRNQMMRDKHNVLPVLKTKSEENEKKQMYWLGYGFDDYFMATAEEVELAEYIINKKLRTEHIATIGDFLDALHLEPNSIANGWGWGWENIFGELDTGWILLEEEAIDMDNGEQAIALSFSCIPSEDVDETNKLYENADSNRYDTAPWEE